MSVLSYRSLWANHCHREHIAAVINDELRPAQQNPNIGELPSVLPDVKCSKDKLPLPPKALNAGKFPKHEGPMHVAIIGAGCAGLFTAMIIEHLNECVPGLNVTYEIFEAADKERLGGRVFTKKIGPGDHDYYDIGAMRFPENKIMKRTFDLFEELDMKKNKSDTRQKGDLIPYFMEGNNCPTLCNDVQHFGKPPKGNFYRITGVPSHIIREKTAVDWLDLTVKAYKEKFLEYQRDNKMKEAWELLMKVDQFSTRQMMYNPAQDVKKCIQAFDFNTVEWIETFNVGTRWFDQAFSETVLEALDFDSAADWWCIEGGTQQVAARMSKKLRKGEVVFNKQVTSINMVDRYDPCSDLDVSFRDDPEPKTFTAVFNSATLGAMQRMDLSGLDLNYGTKAAIRSLGYSASCKVCIRFSKMWWRDCFNIDKGGVGKTDIPIRVCVYPSYNLKDTDGGVLLCSYTWSQDAERIGALINENSPKNEGELKRLLIHNLARLHSPKDDKKEYDRVFEIINGSYQTHHAYDWYKDPHATGAFAYFGPGQFQKMYPYIVQDNGKHVIIGECASSHHAWIVGALESATRGVYSFLYWHSGNEFARAAMEKYDKGTIRSPYGPLPPEYDRPKGVADTDGNVSGEALPCDIAKQLVLTEWMRNVSNINQEAAESGASPAPASATVEVAA